MMFQVAGPSSRDNEQRVQGRGPDGVGAPDRGRDREAVGVRVLARNRGRGHIVEVPAPRHRVTMYARDHILILVLLFMIGLVATKWEDYHTCRDPLGVWLLVNFLSLLAFRLLSIFAQYYWNGPRGSWSQRVMPRVLCGVLVWVMWPFLFQWCIQGCVWYARSKECLPESMNDWSLVAWIVLSLIYLLMYGVLIATQCYAYAYRLRYFDIDQTCCKSYIDSWKVAHLLLLQHLQRGELVGMGFDPRAAMVLVRVEGLRFQVEPQIVEVEAFEVGPDGLPIPPRQRQEGLTAEQIDSIPIRELEAWERKEKTCSICLIEFPQLPPGDYDGEMEVEMQEVRKPSNVDHDAVECKQDDAPPQRASIPPSTPASSSSSPPQATQQPVSNSRVYSSDPVFVRRLHCDHVFHRACIDLWLATKSICPNCRMDVRRSIPNYQHEQEQSHQHQRHQQQQQQQQQDAGGLPWLAQFHQQHHPHPHTHQQQPQHIVQPHAQHPAPFLSQQSQHQPSQQPFYPGNFSFPSNAPPSNALHPHAHAHAHAQAQPLAFGAPDQSPSHYSQPHTQGQSQTHSHQPQTQLQPQGAGQHAVYYLPQQ